MTDNIIPFGEKSSNKTEEDYKKFQIIYRFEDRNWSFEIWAKSLKEAHHRINDIKHFPVDVSEIVHQEN